MLSVQYPLGSGAETNIPSLPNQEISLYQPYLAPFYYFFFSVCTPRTSDQTQRGDIRNCVSYNLSTDCVTILFFTQPRVSPLQIHNQARGITNALCQVCRYYWK